MLRTCNRIGLKSRCSQAPGRHLPYQHPQMEAMRTFIKHCGSSHGVHPQLVGNFDQVWTALYEHKKRTYYKPIDNEGSQNNHVRNKTTKMVTAIRKALGLEGDDDKHQKQSVVEPGVTLNAEARISPIEQWRFPRTTTTLSWCDGELGASWVTIKEGSAPQDLVDKLNDELKGLIEIHVQDSRSHMWTATSTLHYLRFLSVQIRLRRIKLGLQPSQGKALILSDKATQHSCTTFEQLRERWEQENGAILIHGSSSSTIKVPPGWGAAGSPNDGFHQFYHMLRKAYQRLASSQGHSLHLRKRLDELDLSVDGNIRYSKLC